jgi:hypothetical protein
MTRITVAPRECPLCDCRMVEPDAQPFDDWTWRCNNCGYTTFEEPQVASGEQRAWATYFAQTRPRERAEWVEQYSLQPERVR